jgi:2-keto-4-pentenoate hydratase
VNAAGTAALLVEARRTGRRIGTLAGELLPLTVADAYAVQDEAMRLLGIGPAGWKVGGADPTAEPIAAPLLSGLVLASPARLAVPPESFRGVEAELALSLARDLPARARPYGDDEAWDAVGGVHVAIEFLDNRYADRRAMSAEALLADNQSNGGFCYGPANPVGTVDFLAAKASLAIDGKEAKRAVGGNPAGHPKRLLGWLANHAASRGKPLCAGNIVTTGSHTGFTIAPPGSRVVARFEGLGEAALEFVSK